MSIIAVVTMLQLNFLLKALIFTVQYKIQFSVHMAKQVNM
jgi:hypothetical protein